MTNFKWIVAAAGLLSGQVLAAPTATSTHAKRATVSDVSTLPVKNPTDIDIGRLRSAMLA